jgi:hypothetical protein
MTRRRVLHLRRKRRWGADRIAYEVGLASSTVQHIRRSAGLGRLDHGDRATDTSPVRRYQRDWPGELIHVDVKKIAAIPTGGRLESPRPRRPPLTNPSRVPLHPHRPG